MANANFYSKNKPCTPPSVNGVTMAYDSGTGLWKGTTLDTTVAALTAAGTALYSASEVTRFRYDADNITAKADLLVTAQSAADVAAVALAADSANGTKQTTLAAASAAVSAAADAVTAARTAAAMPHNGKANPFV